MVFTSMGFVLSSAPYMFNDFEISLFGLRTSLAFIRQFGRIKPLGLVKKILLLSFVFY